MILIDLPAWLFWVFVIGLLLIIANPLFRRKTSDEESNNTVSLSAKPDVTKQFYREVDQLTQRFNYFILASSFLFLGFVTLYTSAHIFIMTGGRWIVAFTILAGIFLSIYYFLIAYHQSLVAQRVMKQNLMGPVMDNGLHILEAFGAGLTYLFRVDYFARKTPASFTWAIPFYLAIFWVILGICWCIDSGMIRIILR